MSGWFFTRKGVSSSSIGTFKTIQTSSGTSPVATSLTDTLTINAGAGITVTGNSGTDTIVIAATPITTSSISSNTNAASGTTYLCNTSGGAFTLTLPSSPSTNDSVGVKDSNGTFNTNQLTVARNGKDIEGKTSDYICYQNYYAALFVYNGTQWVIT